MARGEDEMDLSQRRLRQAPSIVLSGILLLTAPATPLLAAEAADPAQRVFATPEEAVDALVAAAKADDEKGLLAVLGPEAKSLIDSGDAVSDKATRERFVKSYETAHSLVKSEDGAMTLQTGKDDWPFPIPLEKSEKGWWFDTAEGKEEIIDRRIGANELAAIQTCLAISDAQLEYHDRNPEGDPLPAYAQQLASSPGKRDGLYWETKPGEEPSPLGELLARARGEGYRRQEGKPTAYHGYYYRLLKAQGPHARGGAYDYVAHGRMIGGFALVAYPATYRSSGIMTFIVNQDGTVYQKDLGPETEKLAQAMKTFDPDSTWKAVPKEDEEPSGT
jgi:hypothetical protein